MHRLREENGPPLRDGHRPKPAFAFVVQHQQAACAGFLGDQDIGTPVAIEVGDIQACLLYTSRCV